MDPLVIAIYWLTTGEPAFDYRERKECELLQALTEANGGVTIELQSGQMLAIERIECRERQLPASARAPS